MAWYDGQQPTYGQPPYYGNGYYYGPNMNQSPYMNPNMSPYGSGTRQSQSQNQTQPSQQQSSMQQQSSQLNQQQQPMMNKNTNLNCRIVSSFDEVKIAQVDIDGSTAVFLDVVNHKVYTKKILADGRPEYRAYNEVPVEEFQTTTEYVTKAELEKILNNFKNSISSSAQGAVQQDSNAPQLNFFEGNGK